MPAGGFQEEGTTQGYAWSVDCVGDSLTCSVSGSEATIEVSGVDWSSVPSSASSTCTGVEVARDNSYLYICTDTNTWRRVEIATWTSGYILLETGDYILLESGDKIVLEA